MKLSILIVNWNTKEHVIKCVNSVLRDKPGFDYEIIVVDNASSDGSAQELKRLYDTHPKIKIIASQENLGFAGGNNLALGQAQGEYILLLNSDTEVRAGALGKLINYLEENREVGVVGPKLLNTDGSQQPSVRRFPALFDQILIFSGLHKLTRPKNYLMDNFDYTREQEVDQVMGAALLTRRKIIEELGGLFDEQFYLWYEEVDFCMRVKNAGYKVKYFPGAEVVHHGGQSFSQVRVYERKKIAGRSLLHYFRKNKPWWQTLVLRLLMPAILALTWVLNKIKYRGALEGWYEENKKPAEGARSDSETRREARQGRQKTKNKKLFILLLAGMVGVEILSLLAFRFEGLSLPLLIVIGVSVFAIAFYRLEWGIYLLFAELFFGSRGRLFEAEIFGFDLSLRMVVFSAVLLAWLLSEYRILNIEYWKKIQYSKFHILYSALVLVIGYGIVWGYFQGNGLANIFQDANGYLYLLILPAVVTGIQNSEFRIPRLFDILAAAIVLVAVKTLLLFIWFTYDFYGVSFLYSWVIQNDLGEITGILGGAPRIFMQSQFYALMGVFIFGLSLLSLRGENRRSNPVEKKIASPAFGSLAMTYIILSAAILSVILSLSRSFWLGGFFGAVFAVLMLLWYFRIGVMRVIRWGAVILMIAALEIGALYLITSFSGDKGVTGAVASRVGDPTAEAAGGARLLLLPELVSGIQKSPIFGSGFGETVSYDSHLPDRITPENPTGEIVNFAFEWGYLDMLLKVGATGLIVYLLFIANIFSEGIKIIKSQFSISKQIPNSKFQILGLMAGLVALLTLNITTPYLNHPLGIGYLILVYISFIDFELSPYGRSLR